MDDQHEDEKYQGSLTATITLERRTGRPIVTSIDEADERITITEEAVRSLLGLVDWVDDTLIFRAGNRTVRYRIQCYDFAARRFRAEQID